MPDKCTAPEGLTMAARWQDTVHGHMETARQCAALTAITMLENSTATWEWMIMIAGWVTSALQKNAQQEHTEDKINVLNITKTLNLNQFPRYALLSVYLFEAVFPHPNKIF